MVSASLVHEARLRAGLTQQALGDRLGLPKSTVNRYERGRVVPSLERLREVVAACGLDLTFDLRTADDSYDAHILRSLRRTPEERLDHAVAQARTQSKLRAAGEAHRARQGTG